MSETMPDEDLPSMSLPRKGRGSEAAKRFDRLVEA